MMAKLTRRQKIDKKIEDCKDWADKILQLRCPSYNFGECQLKDDCSDCKKLQVDAIRSLRTKFFNEAALIAENISTTGYMQDERREIANAIRAKGVEDERNNEKRAVSSN